MEKIREKWFIRCLLCIIAVLLVGEFALAEENPYDKAVKAYLIKDYKTAVKSFSKYVEKKPDSYAYYLLGYALYEMNKYAESAKYFKEAYLIDPTISPISVKKSEIK
jgi:TolA-binding protein